MPAEESPLTQTSQVAPEFLCPECERVFGNGYERCPFDGARLVNLGAGLAAGTVVDNRYTIKRLLGKGGMGSVYVARQHSMDRDVAMKIMHHRADGNHASVQRFFWEVRAARRLQSPHTITVFDFGQTERGSLYLAMELLKGTTLGHLLSVEQRISAQLALRVSMQICRSLEEAHNKGIIHRDLKPENIFLVQRNGTNDYVKVLDFGVAKFLDPDGQSPLTQTGTVFGTPRYMSPEQANSESVDARSDLYSLGIMMYEMLTGRVPFAEDNALELLYKQVHAKPTPLGEVAPWLQLDPRLGQVVDGLLEKRREDRPQSATAVREALEALAGELPDDEVAESPPPLPMIGDAPPPPKPHGTADTQQALDARELLRREMQTPSLGLQPGHDGRSKILVGRPDQSNAARSAIEEGLEGPNGRVVFITGERGLGKTRLTRWLAAAAVKEHDAVLAQSREATHAPNDMPEVRAAIEHLLGVTLLERTALRQALEDHPAFSDHVETDLIAALTDFLRPPLKPSRGDGEDADEVQLLFSVIFRLLVRVSKIRPVLFDAGLLNRAAPMTLRFLEYLTAALPFSPARLVILARVDTSTRPRHAVLRGALEAVGWRGESNPAVRHVALRRLGGQEFKELLQSLGKVYIHLVDYLHYLSGGVPRVAAALVRQIESEPERLHIARMWNPIGHRTALAELPRDLVDEAERHLERVVAAANDPRALKRILRIAALVGNTFDIGFLEDCVGRDDDSGLVDAVEEVLDLLVDEGCLHEVDGNGDALRFDNGILRELILSRIRSRRVMQQLHGTVAAAIAALPGPERAARALELATHHACSGDYERALEHHLVHARAARAAGTTDAALQAYLAAAEMVGQLGRDARSPGVEHAEQEIIGELAHIHYELGLYEQAAESFAGLCERAREAGDEAGLARAERGLAEVQDALAEYGAATELFESSRDRSRALGKNLDAAWCELKRAGSLERRGLTAQARTAYDDARQTFARERDDRGLADAFNALGLLALREGDASEALRHLRRAADLFKKLQASLDLGKALYNLSQAANLRRDLLMALDAANKALEIFDRHDYRVGISQCLGTIAKVLVTQRRPAEARPFFERALRIRENLGDRRGVAEAVSSLADIALSLDQHERALELAFRGRDIYTSIGEFLGAANALRTMGLAQSALGRYEDALAYLREAVATYESLSAKDGDLCDILQSLAECQDRMGLRSDARITLGRALELARELSLSHHTGHLEARLRALA